MIARDFPGVTFDGSKRVSCANAEGRQLSFSGKDKESVLMAVFDGGGRKYMVIGRAPADAAESFTAAFTALCGSMHVDKVEKGTGGVFDAPPAGAGPGTPPRHAGAQPANPFESTPASSNPFEAGADVFEKPDPLGKEVRCEPGGFIARGPAGWSWEEIEGGVVVAVGPGLTVRLGLGVEVGSGRGMDFTVGWGVAAGRGRVGALTAVVLCRGLLL